MKNVILLFLALAACGVLVAQPPSDNKLLKEKMLPMMSWTGKWKGEGFMNGPGGQSKSTVDETIEAKLDNTIIVVEGLGKAADPGTNPETVVHNAFGVLSYDQKSEQYKFRSYLKDGRSTDAWFNVVADNKYQWGFESPMGKIRYSISIDPAKKTWNEIGEFSQDGNNWRKFFEMNLTKVN